MLPTAGCLLPSSSLLPAACCLLPTGAAGPIGPAPHWLKLVFNRVKSCDETVLSPLKSALGSYPGCPGDLP